MIRCLLAALALLALPAATDAAVLIEATRQGLPLRLVIDRQTERVRVQEGPADHLVDLGRGLVYTLEPAPPGRSHARFRPGHDRLPPYRLDPFGPGPIRAGNATIYHVLFTGDDVCAEVLATPWMRPFVDPGVRALAILDARARRATGPGGRPPTSAEACAMVPITTLAAAGWPMLVGKLDQPTFETRTIRFDYQPAPDELALPEGSPARASR